MRLPTSFIAFALLSLTLAAPGCAAGGTAHPDYARLKPRDIAVLKVKNETIADLSDVAFGGLLQRAVIGAERYNVLELLRGAIEEAILKSGYTLAPVTEPLSFDPAKPLPPDAAPPAFQGVLTAAVEAWHADTMSSFSSFTMRYRIELRRVPTAELLYSGTFFCNHEESRAQTISGVPGVIRRSAARALGALPPLVE